MRPQITLTSKPKTVSPNVYSPMASLAFRFSFIFAVIALIILLLYSIGEAGSIEIFFDILGIVIVIAFASFAVGGIVGFLFGIPHTVQQNTVVNTPGPPNNSQPTGTNNTSATNPALPGAASQNVSPPLAESSLIATRQSKSNYTPSTNLEQIADWLTKIIVGVGLTQIHHIINLFNQLCLALGTTLQHYSSTHHNGALVVGAIIILFSIEGFLIVYLWTYLYLIRIQDSIVSASDIIETISSKIAGIDVNDKQAIDLASKQLSLPDGAADVPITELIRAFQSASKNVISTIFFNAVSMRKKCWKNIDTKYKIEKTIPIFQALIAVDSSFEFPENYAELAFALKDKRTPDYKQALVNLDKAIMGFSNNDKITNKAIVFFNRAYCRIKLDENFANNQPGTGENKQLILSDLNEASKEPYVANIIANDPLDTAINNWKGLNP